MKPAVLVGIVLLVIGVAALGYQGFTYTTKEKVVDIGPIEINKETKHRFPLGPVVGVAALVGGILLVVTGSRKK